MTGNIGELWAEATETEEEPTETETEIAERNQEISWDRENLGSSDLDHGRRVHADD
jgi:peptidoglycan hydrolase CwlO-like protein